MRGMAYLALADLLIAPTPAAAEAAPFDFQCNAPFRENSEFWQEQAGPVRRVTGRIHLQSLHDILPQPPGEELRIIGPVPDTRGGNVELIDWDDSIFVTLGIGPHNRSSETLEVVLSWQIGDETHTRLLTTLAERNYRFEPVPFTIVTDGRRVTVEAAGARAEVAVAIGPDIEVRVGCSGGEFFFEDLGWDG